MMDEKDLKEYEDNIRLVQGIKLSLSLIHI